MLLIGCICVQVLLSVEPKTFPSQTEADHHDREEVEHGQQKDHQVLHHQRSAIQDAKLGRQ